MPTDRVPNRSEGDEKRPRSAVKAIRARCLDCVGSPKVVRDCGGELVLTTEQPCPLYPWRFGCSPEMASRRGEAVECGAPRRSAVKAIRDECLSCVCGEAKEVAYCPSVGCALWRYRFGVRPDTARARGHIVDPERFVLVRTDLDPVTGGTIDYAVLADGRRIPLPANAWRRMADVADQCAKMNALAQGQPDEPPSERTPLP